MKTKKIIFILVASLFIFVFSCKKEHKQPEDIVVENTDEELVYPLPTPFEVTQMLQNSGTPYNFGLANELTKVDSYNSEKAKALNLGIYGADLAYAATYNQAQTTRDILLVIKKLADNLNISVVLNKNISERIEQNILNQDSLYKIVNNSFIRTFNELNKQSQGPTSILVITGALIEVVYIATQIAITSSDKSPLVYKIAEQKYNINSLIPLLQKYNEKNKDIAYAMKIVLNFKKIFDKIQADDEGNLIIDNATFDELSIYAKKTRTEIINLK